MAETAKVEIVLNGERYFLAEGSTVALLLDALGLDAARVAVELDREILPRAQWSTSVLRNGSQVEVVQFVGGGWSP
jgi:thiamine biosynthesis protein ThiS